MKETVLVTGGTGLLGSSLVPYLSQKNYNLIVHGNRIKADFNFNLANEIEAFQELDKIKPSVIINLVGVTNVDLCEENIQVAYLGNTRTVETLSNWINHKSRTCYLIHISTDQVYSAGGGKEEHINILNNYALTKYAGELAAKLVYGVVLRTNFFGKSPLPNRKSFVDWIYESMKNNLPINAWSDVMFSPIAIKSLISLIEKIIEIKPVGIYNVGSNNGMSKSEFILTFADLLKLPSNKIKLIKTQDLIGMTVQRPKDMRMDNSKIEHILKTRMPDCIDEIKAVASEYI